MRRGVAGRVEVGRVRWGGAGAVGSGAARSEGAAEGEREGELMGLSAHTVGRRCGMGRGGAGQGVAGWQGGVEITSNSESLPDKATVTPV